MEKGYTLSLSFAKQLINDTDAYADCVIDGVYRGGNCFLQMTSKEYKAGVLAAAMPYSVLAPTGANTFGPGVIGRLDSAIAGAMILSATAATPAASSPATLTATYCIFAENYDISMLFGPEHRKVPMRFRFLLYLESSVPAWFKTT